MKKYPLPIILALSFIIVVLCGFALSPTARSSFLPDSYISSLFSNLHSGDLFSQPTPEPDVKPAWEQSTPEPSPLQTPAATLSPPPTAEISTQQTPFLPMPPQVTEEAPPVESPPATPAPTLPVVQNFTQVDSSYFNDALFVGDSRMVGMSEYSGIDKATYYASVGMTIYNLLDTPFISLGGYSKPVTLDFALQQNQFGKIYIMVGINEMGTGSSQRFRDAYYGAVQRIKELQPNAVVFIQAILYVTASRSETDEVFSNNRIRERNNCLAELADGKQSFYIDVNEIMSDGKGNLNQDLSWDTCHLKAQYYFLWADFLMKHGVVPSDAKV